MANILSREAILAANDLKSETVAVPEWGGEVLVRTMTGTERDSFEEMLVKAGNSTIGIRARLASLCLVDGKGERLFSDEDVDVLGGKSAAALDRIFAVAQKLNGFSDKDIEDLEKN